MREKVSFGYTTCNILYICIIYDWYFRSLFGSESYCLKFNKLYVITFQSRPLCRHYNFEIFRCLICSWYSLHDVPGACSAPVFSSLGVIVQADFVLVFICRIIGAVWVEPGACVIFWHRYNLFRGRY